ncbi:4-(cytidine 5'-diphospho)-2-C-methyl-D-erythritol kinase [Candidatus Endobugula sertula]|uniref:4-diphosphocytidyl-2-C-methyl-D-erythritol kinase n=1 Tax=Candidatus Endobugula sertula TaxID=62101 RepID=A0A1D2QMZ9_9GAMM|nr:4-(cytidine 5'-diphospho)-2-C-methyl-D-erythritol kinase [Candidatus Endobugula sertula]
MPSLHLFSPAKLNLFLHITGRLPNGYHKLQTVFQLLDYGDSLALQTRKDGNLQLTPQLLGINQQDNLIIRAAYLLKQQTQTDLGANIQLLKRLPMGGGMGGGSSNAATTLIGLNHLWQTGLSVDQLTDIGMQLGADVPVFVRGNSAWAEGIGEKLSPLKLPERWYLVIKPQCHVSTAEIFSHQQLTRDTGAITVAAFFEQGGHNDCEHVVSQCYPEVAEALRWLRQYSAAQLTGTGACVFASFTDQDQAKAIFDKASTKWECFTARGINHSPLQPLL